MLSICAGLLAEVQDCSNRVAACNGAERLREVTSSVLSSISL